MTRRQRHPEDDVPEWLADWIWRLGGWLWLAIDRPMDWLSAPLMKLMDLGIDLMLEAPAYRAALVKLVQQVLKWMQYRAMLTFKTNSRGEDWATTLGWFIPRKYRNDIIGDILEDCAEMRDLKYTERRIRFHVVYQWIIAVITLVPTAVKTSITDILKQVISPLK